MADQLIQCPSCGRLNEHHDPATTRGAVPGPGDVGICWGCYGPAIFCLSPLGVLTQREPTPDELREIMTDPKITAAIDAMQRARTPAAAAEAALRTTEAGR